MQFSQRHAFGRRFKPASIKRRIVSDLVTPSASARSSSASIIGGGSRTPTNGSLPVAGRPLFLGKTFIDFVIIGFYRKSEPSGRCNFHPALTATRNNR